MENFYIKIDEEFLHGLAPPVRKKLEQEIMEKISPAKDHARYLRLCPYCNKFTILSLPESKTKEFGAPDVCAICGESNPFKKILLSLEKSSVLYRLSAFCAVGDGTPYDNRNVRTLMEQSIVVLATGLEIFLRDIYSSAMNIKFVKSKHTLFAKFSNESKNDFINIEKTIKKFKSGLDIDLKKVLDDKERGKINELFLKRNAIVHNNGFADNIFITQSGYNCKIGELLPISDEDISAYSKVVIITVDKIEKEFEKIIYPEMHIRIEDF